MKFSKKDLGRMAERLAETHYKNEGYKFLKRNYHCLGSELDLVFSAQKSLVIVEVKLRHNTKNLLLSELIPYKKQKALKRGAYHFLEKSLKDYDSIRFDFVLISYVIKEGRFLMKLHSIS